MKIHCIKYYLHLKYKAWKNKKEMKKNPQKSNETKENKQPNPQIKEDKTKSQKDPTKKDQERENDTNQKIITNISKETKSGNDNTEQKNKQKTSKAKKKSTNKPKKKDPMTKRTKWLLHQKIIKDKGIPFLKQTIKLENEKIEKENKLKQIQIQQETEKVEANILQTTIELSNTQKKKQELINLIKEKKVLEKKENVQILLELQKDPELSHTMTTIYSIQVDIDNAYLRINSRKKCDKELKFIKLALKDNKETHDKLKALAPETYEEFKKKYFELKEKNDKLIW